MPTIEMATCRPGQIPVDFDPQAAIPEDGFLWIDACDSSIGSLASELTPLKLEGFAAGMLIHPVFHLSLDDPHLDRVAEFDAAATSLLRTPGSRVAYLAAFEPRLLLLVNQRPVQVRYAQARVDFLTGPNWLLTRRETAIDLRFGDRFDEAATERGDLIESFVHDYSSGNSTLQIAARMLAWLLDRCVTVAFEIADEIDARMMDLHRQATGEPGELDPQVRRQQLADQLIDLRWALGLHERHTRRLTPTGHADTKRWLAPLGAASGPLIARAAEALDECEVAQRSLAGAMDFLLIAQNAAALEAQLSITRETGRLQSLVAALTAYLAGPALVATVFAALPDWWPAHQTRRFIVLVLLMIGAAIIGHLVVFGRARGPFNK